MYYGQIVWLKNQLDTYGKLKVDINNPDPNKRSAPLVVLKILLGFEYAGVINIYDSKKDKTSSCKAELTNPNKLNVRGYGISIMGCTDKVDENI